MKRISALFDWVLKRLESWLIVYCIAMYLSRISGYFINWGGPPDLQIDRMAWTDHFINFVLAPAFGPLQLWCEIRLTLLWGIDVLPEGFLPLVVAAVSTLFGIWIVEYRIKKVDLIKHQDKKGL